jgi:protein-S-isoprenylcysteine O-methyltransferase Ste14
LSEHNNKKDGDVDSGKKGNKMDKPLSFFIILLIPLYVGVIFALIVFPLAGDWLWVEGWVFVSLFAVFGFIIAYILNKRNPRVIRNRLKFRKEKKMEDKESEKASSSDKFIFPIFIIAFISLFVIPDLDHRFNWSGAFLVWLEIVGFVLLGVGLYIVYLAQLQNAYASKVLDIREDQKLIDTGLYAHVRHPLYSGMLGFIVGIPLGLGSWWALIPAVFCVLGLVIRIKFEEKMLLTGLEGYKEYRERVKYKLIPKIY